MPDARMLNKLWRCVWDVARSWFGALGGLSTLVGGAQQAGLFNAPFPAWAWWLAAIVFLVIAACKSEYALKREKEKNKAVFPDIALYEVVKRVTGYDEIWPISEARPGVAEAIGKALIEIREKAHLGRVSVWGRTGSVFPGHEFSYPLGAIPKEHWANYDMDYLQFLQDRRGKSANYKDEVGYSDIWFCSDQIDEVWPPPSRNIRWRLPFSFEGPRHG